jgi:hypothetical protein
LAVRFGAFASRAATSIASRTNTRDDREAPLWRHGIREENHNLPKNGSKIFFDEDLDTRLAVEFTH